MKINLRVMLNVTNLEVMNKRGAEVIEIEG